MGNCGECKCNGCNFDCGRCEEDEEIDCTLTKCEDEK